MQERYYHWQLEEYVLQGTLPLYIELVPQGTHPARDFHDHNCSEIVFVLKGSSIHLLKTSSSELISSQIHAGDILVVHPSNTHAYAQTDDLEILNIAYDRRQLALPLLDGYMLPLFRKFFPSPDIESNENPAAPIISLSQEELKEIMSTVQRLKDALDALRPGGLFESLALFMEVIISIARLREEDILPGKRVKFMIGKAVRFINSNYMHSITLDQMAHAANMSRRNFCRHFGNMVGTSAATYLLQVRINHSAELLTTSDRSIAEISISCGFSDSNYFCRRFKEVKGLTPRSFRLQSRTGRSSASE